jgi:hypothetical protein
MSLVLLQVKNIGLKVVEVATDLSISIDHATLVLEGATTAWHVLNGHFQRGQVQRNATQCSASVSGYMAVDMPELLEK